MYLGEQLLEQESLSHEYKEFCLKNGVYNYYEYDEIENIITNGIIPIDFNRMIIDNIKTYFLHYIPKYASAFSNCNINNGLISIGINDFGEITGIPYIGELNTEMLELYLHDAFKLIRGNYNHRNCKKDYIKEIKLSVISIDTKDTDTRLYDISTSIIENMKKQREIYNIEYKHYLFDRDIWMKKFSTYSCSVNQLVNGKRHEIVEYVKTNSPNLIHIINRIQSEIPIEIDCIEECKDDPNHHLYWIFRFKDMKIYDLLESKPKPPISPRILHAPYTLITQLSDMRPKFLNNNHQLKYYLLRIHFSGSLGKNRNLEYYHPIKTTWQARCRVVHPVFGPCCLVK
jgi:hypothetical protein